ncbi:estradiol 17-beta-dehydrogenase 8-like [Xenia sp. Carnegie-2017]|uniref:estradiol 17-beta-dehydrogenase 8-like n=1 Tax=Xenia sp. Carnegie-2017 TaxID=2897299 RepID=UPI001F033268|nr:estradiol 17-beta-dehydrogenase 8-like [Xenia sp. Carnegie-2017]XP_046862910.1 estradiol 17-beta-dehydrogenase 8-like [Xenia sp. Carnegie-2017]
MASKLVRNLAGRLALVTGAGGGIGIAICQRLANEGASVIAVDIEGSNALKTVENLSTMGDLKHSHYKLDVTSAKEIHQCMANIQEIYKRYPCIAINCHGITRDDFLIKMNEDSFDEVINVNLKATFLMIQASARGMIESKVENGSIVSIGSISGKVGNLGQANYVASKAAIEAMTRTCAKELAIYGIRCNIISPGFIQTSMLNTIPPKLINKFTSAIPLKRLGSSEDVANAAYFLASTESSYITGANIEVTGGIYM